MEKEELLNQVATLWPHLDFMERYLWIKRLEPIFELEFPEMTKLIVENVHD